MEGTVVTSTTGRVAVPIGELRVVTRGARDRPTVVLVHGYPDTAHLWGPVTERLASDHHVVAYDVRGAGGSSAPPDRRGYELPHLLDDLVAVIDATAGGGPVHLVGHDWGAIQGFAAVRSPAVAARLSSFTALSAPGLEVARWWLRRRLAAPTPAGLARVARQAARSWYVGAFQVPGVPEQVLRRAVPVMVARGGHPHPSPTVAEDAVRGVDLYRANRSDGGLLDPVGTLPAAPPVDVLIGRDDPYVSAHVFDDLRDRLGVPVTEVDGGHWLPLTHPGTVADHLRGVVARTAG
jgi:pimeloyl-ACP methyl ester carboxylesterase